MTVVDLTKVSASADNTAIFAGKLCLFSPLLSEIYQVPPFVDFIALSPERILLVEDQSGDLIELNIRAKAITQRVNGRGSCRSTRI